MPPVQNKHISALCNCLKTNDRTPNLSSLRLPLRLFPRTPFLKSRPFFLTFHGHSRHFSSIFSTAPPKSLRFPPLKGNLSPLSLSSTNRGSPSAQRRHQPLRACPRLRPCFFQLAPNFSSAPSPQLAPASLRASPPLQPASLPQSVPAFPSELLSARSRLSLSSRPSLSAALSSRLLCSQLVLFLQLAPASLSARALPSARAFPPALPATHPPFTQHRLHRARAFPWQRSRPPLSSGPAPYGCTAPRAARSGPGSPAWRCGGSPLVAAVRMLRTEKVLQLRSQQGRSVRVVREHYLRPDVPCRSALCRAGCPRGERAEGTGRATRAAR